MLNLNDDDRTAIVKCERRYMRCELAAEGSMREYSRFGR